MKRLFALVILLLPITCYLLPVKAQQTDSLWLSMPEKVCPAMKVSDVLPDTVTRDFFSASITTASFVQMRLLPTSDRGEIICVTKTYNADGAESEVEFYDKSWNKLGQQSFTLEDVIPQDSLLPKLKKLLSPLLISAKLNPYNTDIELAINPVQLSEEQIKEIKGVKLQRILKWKGETFK